MENKQPKSFVLPGLLLLAGLALVLFLPPRSRLANLDFAIFDTNDNFHYEVGEPLELLVNDTAAVRGEELVWQMGDGHTLTGRTRITYSYADTGRYLITLRIGRHHTVNKYIKVLSPTEHPAKDSIPHIHGVSEGYQGEVLVFSAEGEGMERWEWEFGESGTVDAYEQQATYAYETPGHYTVSLLTNTVQYPVTHDILILPRFEKAEELVTVDSLALAQEDIRRHLQAIANTPVSQRAVYYSHVRHIRSRYFCLDPDQVVVIVNHERYNDFNSYCQGLHFLESGKKRRVRIDEVKIDTIRCIESLHVTQSYIEP